MESIKKPITYVLGVAKTLDDEYVLIQKNRPESLKGLLNFVGGKVEPDEQPRHAMKREFKEETGVETNESKWIHIGDFFQPSRFVVVCYKYKECSDIFKDAVTSTDEHVVLVPETRIVHGETKTGPNVEWIVKFIESRDHERYNTRFKVEYNDVGEEYLGRKIS